MNWRCSVVEEVNRHIVSNLSSLYTIQSKSILSRPSIPRSEIDEIIRDAYVNDNLEREMVTKALGVKGGVDQHALYAGAVQPAGGGGTGQVVEVGTRAGAGIRVSSSSSSNMVTQDKIVGTTLAQIHLGRGDRFLRWVGYLPTHRQGLCHRCPRRR